MHIERYRKDAFTVIGKEGSSADGPGFVQRLWEEANTHFSEISHLASRDKNGNIQGIWGIMSDHSRSFQPWEDDFSRGLYLAGVECAGDAVPSEGWSKWSVPGFEYLRVECDRDTVFSEMISHMRHNGIPLVGAVQDFTCPVTGKNYMLFPVKKLDK